MLYNVTKIQKVSNKLVLFWNGTELIRPITIINSIDTRPGIMRLHTDTEIFEFNVYNVLEITDGTTTRTYTALSLTTTDDSRYKTRFQVIFQFLVTNILRGCCCDDSNTGSSGGLIQYTNSNATPLSGEFAFNLSGTGKLLLNLVSDYNQDFTDLLHHYSNGSRVWFFSADDQSVYTCFEIANYALVGTNATWDASVLDGASTFTDGAIFYVVLDESGSGGGSQSWQQTLDVDSTLDKDNTVDADSFDFTWNNVADYAINSNSSISESVDLTATANQIITDAMQLDTVVRQIIDYDTGDEGAHGSEILAGIIDSFIRVRNEGESLEISFTVKKDGTYVRSALVNAGTAVVGHPYVLQSATTGKSDFNQLTTVGIKDGAVTFVKIQTVNKDSLLGRGATSGVVEEILCTSVGRDIIGASTVLGQRTILGIKQCIALSGGNLGGTIAAGATVYFAPTVDATPGATETARCSVIAFSGTVVSFYYQTFATQPATGSLVLTFRRAIGMGAFASTSVVVTIAAGSAAGIFSDTVNTATTAAGDRVSIQGTNNASTASASIGSWQIIVEQSY